MDVDTLCASDGGGHQAGLCVLFSATLVFRLGEQARKRKDHARPTRLGIMREGDGKWAMQPHRGATEGATRTGPVHVKKQPLPLPFYTAIKQRPRVISGLASSHPARVRACVGNGIASGLGSHGRPFTSSAIRGFSHYYQSPALTDAKVFVCAAGCVDVRGRVRFLDVRPYHVMHELVNVAAGTASHPRHGDWLVREAMASTTGECLTLGKLPRTTETVTLGYGQWRHPAAWIAGPCITSSRTECSNRVHTHTSGGLMPSSWRI